MAQATARADDLLAGVAEAGFWVAPRDALRTLGEIVAQGQALAAGCARCGHTRQWFVCGEGDCRSSTGTLAVLGPPDRRPGARRRHLSDRDIARIHAMAAQATETYRPPILEDLDAPIRVGACLPGQETYVGAQVIAAWRGRLILGWPLGRRARDRRRAVDDMLA